ncbi:hypothetical protein AAFC00_005709 [Neodothiora populina]|uniref:SUR7-domain-containing protein n=1 Tax=Neodothiora populina TaxID=2781224 RepID=A0ABR3P5W9_9PEZI
MTVARPIIGFTSLIILGAGILFSFFTILSGIANVRPFNLTYFLEADTTGIDGARNPARWTFFKVCSVVNGRNGNCGEAHAALPFDPPRNFGTTTGVPATFIGTHHYYYLSRFMFAFYLIALFFACIALLTGCLAMCSRLGSYLTGATCSVALFFQAITASLMTACYVQGRDAFQRNGESARYGRYAFGWTWGAFAAYLVCTVLYCVGGSVGKNKTDRTAKKSMFSRKRSTRSRGSFIDSESQRRVKDEYE